MGWIFRLCTLNMKRRRTRTILTVLGVTIGVISIVSLLSIGIGVKDVMLKDYETGDTVRRIIVHGEEIGKRKDKMLSDRTMEYFCKLSHVETVYPMYEILVVMQMDKYISYARLCGIPAEQLERFELVEGSGLSGTAAKPKLVFGNLMGMLFYNENTGNSYIEAESKTTKEMLGKKLQVNIGVDDSGFSDKLTVDGVMKGDDDTYSMQSQSVYCDLDVLLRYLKRKSPDGNIVGQPVDSQGNAYKDFIYSSAVVIVDDIAEVDAVVKKLQDMGFQTENEKE